MKFVSYVVAMFSVVYLCGFGGTPKIKIQQVTAVQNPAAEEQQGSDTASNELALIPAPWADGEIMRLKVTSLQGDEIGTMIYSAERVTGKGDSDKSEWRIISHHYVSSSNLRQYSAVEAQPKNFRPSSSYIANLSGNFKVEYGNQKIQLTSILGNNEITKAIDVNSIVYDSEQLEYLVRRLPLKEGYKVSFPVFAAASGTAADCNVIVVGKEQVKAAGGTFDCYRVNLAIYSRGTKQQEHAMWISADEHRYLTRYILSMSMIMELAEVTVADKEMPLAFEDSELGLAVAVPYGWRFYKYKADPGFCIELLAPELKARAALCVLPVPSGSNPVDIAVHDVAAYKGLLIGYEVRNNEFRLTTAGRLNAAQYVADFLEEGNAAGKYPRPKEMVEYRTYIVAGDRVYFFIFRTEKDKFASLKSEFDAIIQSFEIKK